MIYVPRLGMRVRFDSEGEYHTDDEAEIKALSKNRNVERLITSKEHGTDVGGDQASLVTSKDTKVLTDQEREELEQDLAGGSGAEVEDFGGQEIRAGHRSSIVPGASKPPVIVVESESLDPINHKDYTRPVLDAMAENLGLDPKEYGNKKVLTEAINEARKRRG